MTSKRYKIKVTYDGTNFAGFQIQPDSRTIQGEIEKGLSKMAKGSFIRIHGAGRTDAGVHAVGQVIHFDFPIDIPPEGILQGMNSILPESIRILECEEVSNEFHSRYDATGKKYIYRIHNSKTLNPFTRFYTYHHRYPMDLNITERALKYFEGTHDFSSFTSTGTDKENKIREIKEASVKVDPNSSEWIFTFVGDGFLYNMIRIIMGTVLQVADGRKKLEELPQIIEAKDRNKAGPTLSAKGLCMYEVYYDENRMKK